MLVKMGSSSPKFRGENKKKELPPPQSFMIRTRCYNNHPCFFRFPARRCRKGFCTSEVDEADAPVGSEGWFQTYPNKLWEAHPISAEGIVLNMFKSESVKFVNFSMVKYGCSKGILTVPSTLNNYIGWA